MAVPMMAEKPHHGVTNTKDQGHTSAEKAISGASQLA